MSAIDDATAFARDLIIRASQNPNSITWQDLEPYRALDAAARSQASELGNFSANGNMGFIQFNDLLQAVNRYRRGMEPLRSPSSQQRLDDRRDPANWPQNQPGYVPPPAPGMAPTPGVGPNPPMGAPPSGGLLPNPEGPYTGPGPTLPPGQAYPPTLGNGLPQLPPNNGPQPLPPVPTPTPGLPPTTTRPPTPGGGLPPTGGGGGGNADPLASWGFTRGPNGEFLPIMMQQGANPFQMGNPALQRPGLPGVNPLQFPQMQFDPTMGQWVMPPMIPGQGDGGNGGGGGLPAPVPPSSGSFPPNPIPPGGTGVPGGGNNGGLGFQQPWDYGPIAPQFPTDPNMMAQQQMMSLLPSPAVMPPEQIDPYRIGAEPMTKPQYGMKPPIYTKPQIPGGKGTPLMPPISNNRLGGLLGAYPALGGALGTPILTNVDVM